MYKISFITIVFFLQFFYSDAQELQSKVTVVAAQVGSQIDKKVFKTLETALSNFVNNRKWTNDVFQASEKIQCNFLLNISEEKNNIYKASLTIQAARPVYNSSYLAPLVNYKDDDVVFQYQEFQPVDFNENRVQGNNPIEANLPAVFAYWINIILGFDYGSFSIRGGDPYFQKALNIVNNAPESGEISGWRSQESQRNRYWLANNLTNSRFALIHDAIYSYYRTGLDVFYENEDEGRTGVFNCINFLNTLNTENPNSMVMQFFFLGKTTEMVNVFSKANSETKARAREILSKIDITNTRLYNDLK